MHICVVSVLLNLLSGWGNEMTVFVLLRGGFVPRIYQGVYATLGAAERAGMALRKEFPDIRFKVIEVEVGNG